MKTWKYIVALIALSLFYILAGKLVYFVVDRVSYQVTPNSRLEANFEPKTSDCVDRWIDDLAKMEGCALEGTWDSGSLSYGELCFKKQTYLHYVKKYEIYPYAEEQELLSNIGDSWTQREITRRMLEEDINNAYHWRTSVFKKGLGLPKI